MNPCSCGSIHIGTDVLYSQGVAMFCQQCGHRGPRAPIEPDAEDWLPSAEAEAKVLWNEEHSTNGGPYLMAGKDHGETQQL